MIGNQHAEDLRRCCDALDAENKRLRDALFDAHRSLDAIATMGGSKDDFMGTMRQVREYANSRARVARAALAQEQGESDAQGH